MLHVFFFWVPIFPIEVRLLFVWQASPSILESAISGSPSHCAPQHMNPVIAGAPAHAAQQYITQSEQASTSQCFEPNGAECLLNI